MSQFVCILQSDMRFVKVEKETLVKMNSEDVIKKYSADNNFLYKKVGSFISLIENNVGNSIDDVLISEKENKISNFIFSTKEKYVFLPVNIITEKDENMFCFILKILEEKNNEIKIDEFSKLVSDALGFENNPISFSINNIEQENDKTFDIHSNLNENSLSLRIEITDKGYKKISMRNHIINEIITSEISYINDLEVLKDVWEKELKLAKCYTPKELSLMFDDIPEIIKTQSSFLEQMKVVSQEKYFSVIAPTFIDFSSHFKSSTNIIINYSVISKLFHEKFKSKQFLSIIDRISKKVNQRDLMSFMITPVQRMPRYQLFIRELIKTTSEEHPDYHLLPFAQKYMDALSRDNDAKSKIVIQHTRVDEIASHLQNQYQLKKPNRKLINMFDVTIKGSHNYAGVFIIFNDVTVLVKTMPKGLYNIIVNGQSHMFHFVNGKSAESIVVTSTGNRSIISQRKKYEVAFENKDVKTSFVDIINNITHSHINNADTKYILEWKLVSNYAFPRHCWSSGITFGNNFYIFGGQITQQRIPGSELMIIDKNMQFAERTTLSSGRYGHTIESFHRKLFIIGGRSKNKVFRKMLCFDTAKSKWSQSLPNGNVNFTARYCHTSVTYKNRFYIFGGKTMNKEFLNDLTIYDPQTSTFFIYNMFQNCPQPRSNHAAVVVDNKMFVYGGKNSKEIFNDIWILDLDRLVWQQKFTIGEKLMPRKNHVMFSIGNTIFVIGGTSENCTVIPSYTINTNSMTCHKILDIGNFPNGIKGFSSMTDRGGKFYIAGGLEQKDKEQSQSIYEVSVDKEWLMSILSGNNTLMDEANTNLNRFASTIKPLEPKKPFNVSNFRRDSEGDDFSYSIKRRTASAVSTFEMVDKGDKDEPILESPLCVPVIKVEEIDEEEEEKKEEVVEKEPEEDVKEKEPEVKEEEQHEEETKEDVHEEEVKEDVHEEEVKEDIHEEEVKEDIHEEEFKEDVHEEEIKEEKHEEEKHEIKEEEEKHEINEEEEKHEEEKYVEEEIKEEIHEEEKVEKEVIIEVKEEAKEEEKEEIIVKEVKKDKVHVEEKKDVSSDEDDAIIVPTTKEEKKKLEEAVIEITKKEKAEKKKIASKINKEKKESATKAKRRRELARKVSIPIIDSSMLEFTSKVSKTSIKASKTKPKKRKSFALPPPPPKFIR